MVRTLSDHKGIEWSIKEYTTCYVLFFKQFKRILRPLFLKNMSYLVRGCSSPCLRHAPLYSTYLPFKIFSLNFNPLGEFNLFAFYLFCFTIRLTNHFCYLKMTFVYEIVEEEKKWIYCTILTAKLFLNVKTIILKKLGQYSRKV